MPGGRIGSRFHGPRAETTRRSANPPSSQLVVRRTRAATLLARMSAPAGRGPTIAVRELGSTSAESNRGVSNEAKRSLVVTSLLSILLLTLHITDDIVRGIEGRPSTSRCSSHALPVRDARARRRRSGRLMLLVGLFAAGIPSPQGAHYGEIAKSAGGFSRLDTLGARRARGFTVISGARTVEPSWRRRTRDAYCSRAPQGPGA